MSQIARHFPDQPERWNPAAGMPKAPTVEPPEERVIKTYVWHAGQCYFVSTIERTSSAAANQRRPQGTEFKEPGT